ncbi:hypothetical protein BJY52DRAFT_1209922 [Lactarius psammicola]|nr:hypothetical protein BJY52DRAFT_1209922 [Lactarius psammicola]
MSYPHTATTDPYAFPLWPDASAASEEMMAWAMADGSAQPGPNVGNFYLNELLDTTLAWEQSGTTPAEIPDFQNNSEINWTSGGTAAADMPGHGIPLPSATAVNTTMALAPTTTSPLTVNMSSYAQGFFFTQPDFSTSLSGTPSFTDISSLPSPQSDGTGDGFHPFPTFEAMSSYFPQPSGPSFPRLDIAGALDPDRINCAPPFLFMGGSNSAGQVQSGPILSPLDTFVNMTYSAPLDYTQLTDHPTMFAEASTSMVTREMAPSSSLGKRSRQSDENGSGGPRKKGRPSATRVPGGAESTKRTRRSPATRTQTNFNGKSKATGRGAERLASTTAQGVYRRSLSGLSVPQGSMGALEQEQSSWIEEREQVEMRHDMGSSVPLPSAENAEDGEESPQNPRELDGEGTIDAPDDPG